ncbi:MAG: hypothetical protein JSS64_02645 [Bacteroidetes bacterium]|nr:hypothetical protein [Bacteroidota bacterium]MBS1775161.1 hypothetical protein [Bacteroidota bacterium]
MLEDYLAGILSFPESREVELWLAREGMESDAIDGLAKIPPTEIDSSVQRINAQLRNQVRKGNRQRRRKIHSQRWVWLAMVVIISLVVLAYFLIFILQK